MLYLENEPLGVDESEKYQGELKKARDKARRLAHLLKEQLEKDVGGGEGDEKCQEDLKEARDEVQELKRQLELLNRKDRMSRDVIKRLEKELENVAKKADEAERLGLEKRQKVRELQIKYDASEGGTTDKKERLDCQGKVIDQLTKGVHSSKIAEFREQEEAMAKRDRKLRQKALHVAKQADENEFERLQLRRERDQLNTDSTELQERRARLEVEIQAQRDLLNIRDQDMRKRRTQMEADFQRRERDIEISRVPVDERRLAQLEAHLRRKYTLLENKLEDDYHAFDARLRDKAKRQRESMGIPNPENRPIRGVIRRDAVEQALSIVSGEIVLDIRGRTLNVLEYNEIVDSQLRRSAVMDTDMDAFERALTNMVASSSVQTLAMLVLREYRQIRTEASTVRGQNDRYRRAYEQLTGRSIEVDTAQQATAPQAAPQNKAAGGTGTTDILPPRRFYGIGSYLTRPKLPAFDLPGFPTFGSVTVGLFHGKTTKAPQTGTQLSKPAPVGSSPQLGAYQELEARYIELHNEHRQTVLYINRHRRRLIRWRVSMEDILDIPLNRRQGPNNGEDGGNDSDGNGGDDSGNPLKDDVDRDGGGKRDSEGDLINKKPDHGKYFSDTNLGAADKTIRS